MSNKFRMPRWSTPMQKHNLQTLTKPMFTATSINSVVSTMLRNSWISSCLGGPQIRPATDSPNLNFCLHASFPRFPFFPCTPVTACRFFSRCAFRLWFLLWQFVYFYSSVLCCFSAIVHIHFVLVFSFLSSLRVVLVLGFLVLVLFRFCIFIVLFTLSSWRPKR